MDHSLSPSLRYLSYLSLHSLSPSLRYPSYFSLHSLSPLSLLLLTPFPLPVSPLSLLLLTRTLLLSAIPLTSRSTPSPPLLAVPLTYSALYLLLTLLFSLSPRYPSYFSLRSLSPLPLPAIPLTSDSSPSPRLFALHLTSHSAPSHRYPSYFSLTPLPLPAIPFTSHSAPSPPVPAIPLTSDSTPSPRLCYPSYFSLHSLSPSLLSLSLLTPFRLSAGASFGQTPPCNTVQASTTDPQLATQVNEGRNSVILLL